MIIVDTREKKWSHIQSYFDDNKVEYSVKKLDFGDYYSPNRPSVVIDRKQNLDEVCINLCSRDKERFWREIRNAYRKGVHITILVEHSNNITRVSDVANYKPKYSKVTGRRIEEEMLRAALAYAVDWQFCSKKDTPKRIIELLGVQNE